MHPDLLTIPIIDWPIKSYGAMLTLGFLTGVWMAMRRAERMKADPNVVIDIGFVSLVCGVAGGRLFFVLHYWESSFAWQDSPLTAALNCTSGGLEYYGGLIGAILGALIYMAVKKVSMRMYLDIVAPAAMWGLAFGRLGCLLNGCCWGGLCVDAHGHATVPWGIQFPHGSPAQTRQWENRQLTLPAELIVTSPLRPAAYILPESLLEMSVEKRERPFAAVRQLEERREQTEAEGGSAEQVAALDKRLQEAKKDLLQHKMMLEGVLLAQRYPSLGDPTRDTTVSELTAMAAGKGSLPVHPAQVYAIINALLLSWVLLELLYRRKRHGVVFASMCVLYPITRIILELVRVDNPHDSAGLTISQAVSLGMITLGIIMLIALQRMPLRSPLAVAYVPPPDETTDGAKA